MPKVFKRNYNDHIEEICSMKQDKLLLQAPSDELTKTFVENLAGVIITNAKAKLCLRMKLHRGFKNCTENFSNYMKCKTACQIASNNLVNQVLTIRKMNAGKLLKYIRHVNSLCTTGLEDFGESNHSVYTEPYNYETAYKDPVPDYNQRLIEKIDALLLKKVILDKHDNVFCNPLPIDQNGVIYISEELNIKKKVWPCTYLCHQPSDEDIKAIVELKESFKKSLPEIRKQLQNMDSGYPHIHHFKPREIDDCCDELAHTKLPKLGHPLPYSIGMCHSKL